MNPLREEGEKICSNCNKPKKEHIYQFDLENPWVCCISFFKEESTDKKQNGAIK